MGLGQSPEEGSLLQCEKAIKRLCFSRDRFDSEVLKTPRVHALDNFVLERLFG